MWVSMILDVYLENEREIFIYSWGIVASCETPDPCSVTSYSVPGAFLIIHGRRNNSMAFQLGGALVVSIPIVVGIIFCLILCLRRKSRKLTLNSSTHI